MLSLCKSVKYVYLILFVFIWKIICARGNLPSMEVPPPKLINFLRRFGYLDQNPNDSEALYHESAIRGAIRNVQKYGALNQTGELDFPTLQLLSTPRCGVQDIESEVLSYSRKKRYIAGARSWQKRKIEYFIANWSSKMEKRQIERDLHKAFDMWSRYSRLKFKRVNNTSADVIIAFGSYYHGDNYPFDGPGNILAHAFYPYEMGSYGGDVHFDEDENWKENSTNLSNGVDFYSVALHEIGHSLGLAHSPVYASIMFPYYKGPGQNILDYDDVMAMYELYVLKSLPGDDKPDVYTPKTSSSTFSYEHISETTQPTETKDKKQFTFEGDYDTVHDHKRKHSTNMYRISSEGTTKMPTETKDVTSTNNICLGHFDAVCTIKGAVNIFKGKYVWKITRNYTIANGYPKLIHEILPFLPEHIQKIDAVYERYDEASVYFTGSYYWVYNGKELLEDSPINLTVLIPTATNTKKIDAAMVWPKNNLTYIFAGSHFWKINEQARSLEDNDPKPMQRWVGIPNDIDATATLSNGKTYFFKGNLYWLYNNKLVRPERGYPRRASTAWLRCSRTERTTFRNSNTTVLFI